MKSNKKYICYKHKYILIKKKKNKVLEIPCEGEKKEWTNNKQTINHTFPVLCWKKINECSGLSIISNIIDDQIVFFFVYNSGVILVLKKST